MDLKELYSLVTGKPEAISPGSFSVQHIIYPDNKTEIFDIAILGLPDAPEGSTFNVADEIRKQLYKLSPLSKKLSVLDLGNIKAGKNFNETCEWMHTVFTLLMQTDAKIFLLGNTSDYNKILVDIFIENQIPLNQVRIDSTIKWDHIIANPLSKNQTVTTRNLQVNYTNIGYQSYFVEKEVLDFLFDTDFECYRLGLVRSNVTEFEPILRDANLVNLSLNAVKYSDAPGAINTSPNGLSGDEFCQLAYYYGYGNRMKITAILDYNPVNDYRSVTALLSAQTIWYTLEGMALRINEDPEFTPELFSKYHIHLDTVNQNISFYKSTLTNRWWMEVEFEPKKRSVIFSCSERDYELACKQEIPDRWWRLFKRI